MLSSQRLLNLAISVFALSHVALAQVPNQPGAATSQAAPPTENSAASKPTVGTVLEETWTVVMMGGGRVGYVHSTMTQVGEGDDALITTKSTTAMDINRMGATASIRGDQSLVERAKDGKVLRVDSTSKVSDVTTKTQMTFTDGKAKIVTVAMGRERSREIDIPEEAVGPYQLLLRGRKEGFAPGHSWEAVTFMPELEGATELFVDVIGAETVDIAGKETELTRVETEVDKMAMIITSWINADGLPMKTSMTSGGILIESMTTTKADALAALGQGELSVDVFASSMVVAKRFIPFARFADTAVVTVTPNETDTAKKASIALLSTSSQVVEPPAEDGSVRVTVSRHVPSLEREPVELPDSQEIRDALNASGMIQSDAPEIRKLAMEIVEGEGEPWQQARMIEAWVFKNVEDKNMTVAHGSALEVFENRKGDCSEHAVLCAALCRARGVPARVVMGLLYIGGVWAGHAWNEVWVDESWYPLDATLGLGSADPLRLAMSSMTMQDDKAMEEMLRLSQLLGSMQVRVDEVVHAGHRINVQAEDAVTTKRQVYSNRLWGFTFTAPEGFEFEPEVPSQSLGFELLEVEGQNDDGKRCEFSVSALDRTADFTWKQLNEQIGSFKSVIERKVDGRDARVFDRGSDSNQNREAYVVAGDMIFVLKLDRVTGAADRRMFDEVLGSVDFDFAR